MSMLYMTGKDRNILRRATVTCSPAASTVAPLANLYDNDPSTPFIFGSNPGDNYVQADINALTNPHFTGNITGWTGGAYTSTAGEYRTTFVAGAGAMKLIPTDSSYQILTVPAGESRKFSCWVKSLGGGSVGAVRIQNLSTGLWWTGSTWGAQQNAASSSAGSFTEITTTYTIESFDEVGADHAVIKILLYCESGGSGCSFDDAYDVPGVNWVSVHGHNLRGTWTGGSTTAPFILYSSDAFATHTDIGYFTHRRPAFFYTFTKTYARYWKVLFHGTNYETMYLGEMWLGQYETAAFGPEWGLSGDFEIPGARNVTPLGNASVKNFSVDATRSLSLPFNPSTAAGAKELVESLWLRSGQGRYPTIIVPSDTETAVYYGRMVKPVSQSRVPALYPMSLELQGSPFPTVGA